MTTFSEQRRRLPVRALPGMIGAGPRAALLAVAAAVIGVVCSRVATSHYVVTAIGLLVGVPLVIVIWRRPFVGFLAVLVLAESVFSYGSLPRVNVPGHPPINIADVLLAATVGGTVWRRPWRTWPPAVRRFSVAVSILLGLALIPTLRLAVTGHAEARNAILGFKTLAYMLVGLTIALEMKRSTWRPLLDIAIAFAAVVSILSLAAAASSSVASILTHLDSGAVLTEGSTTRIRLTGLFFVYVITIPTLVLVLVDRSRWRWLRAGALLLMIAAIAVSLNRNMYLGAGIGLLVTLLVGGPRLRHRVLVLAATGVATITLVVSSAVMPAVTAKVSTRAQSAFSTEVLSSGSIQARSDEFSHALTSIGQHPLFGVGWFQPYGSFNLTSPRQGVEDWYLHIATDLGIPVAIAFLLVPAVLLFYGINRARIAARPMERAFLASWVGALIALLLSCMVGAYLQEPDSMMAFGTICGLLLAAGLHLKPRRVRPLLGDEPGPRRPDHAALPA